MRYHAEYIDYLLEKGGPEPPEYHELDAWFVEVIEQKRSGLMTDQELASLREAMWPVFTKETMQGHAFLKPYGYAGDFEMIDRIYRHSTAQSVQQARWDHYFHQQPAPNAVRNRLGYFRTTLDRHLRAKNAIRVLNLASGPGRDMEEFFSRYPQADVHITCIEQDESAIAFAKETCRAHLKQITFIQGNAARLRLCDHFDVIWSAGLFDYFSDNLFKGILRRLRANLASDGEMVIGNFSSRNPNRAYMEFVEWNLHLRSPMKLRALAKLAGFDLACVDVHREETGVNLFLHVRD